MPKAETLQLQGIEADSDITRRLWVRLPLSAPKNGSGLFYSELFYLPIFVEIPMIFANDHFAVRREETPKSTGKRCLKEIFCGVSRGI